MSVKCLKINDYYFHSLIHGFDETLDAFSGILDLGAIASPKIRGIKKRPGCHKIDEICLSKKRKISNAKLYISSFDLYMPELTTLILDKDISKVCRIYQPKIVPTSEILRYCLSGTTTNIYDEYRTRESIPVEFIKGVSIPINNIVEDPFLFLKGLEEKVLIASYNGKIDYSAVQALRRDKSSNEEKEDRRIFINEYIESIQELFGTYGIDIPIYNYDYNQFLLRK